MHSLILRHIKGIQDATRYMDRPPFIIVMVESNLGLEAAHIANMLQHDPQCVCLRETGSTGRYGVLTTHQRKMEFVSLLEQLLMQNSIELCERIVSDDANACISALQKQLHQYRMISSESNSTTVFGSHKVTYSGKVAPNGKVASSALQDDLCIALQLVSFWSSYVVQRKCKFFDYNLYFK
jgi:hypothetical protein